MNRDDLVKAFAEIAKIPEQQAALRKRWTGGKIFLFVDSEKLGEIFSPRCEIKTTRPSFTYTIEIWGDVEGELVILGFARINLIVSRVKETIEFELPTGTILKMKVSVQGERNTPTLQLSFTYKSKK